MSNKDDKTPVKKTIPNALKFVFGGAAGMMGITVVQPLDLIKTRMQLAGGRIGSFAMTRQIIANEGILGLYAGLSASLLRQATYSTTRLGMYTTLLEKVEIMYGGGKNLSYGMKLGIGVIAGAMGAFVGTPADVALIRMTADGRLPPDKRRNYKNVFNALVRIVHEEGVLKLWRGAGPTVFRAMVVNAAQLGTYSQAREYFIKYIADGIALHFCSSMVSGMVTSVASLPVDIIKTKLQNSAKAGRGIVGTITSIISNEGVLALWKGLIPYYFRLGPHTVLTFIFLEQLNAAYLKYS